MQRLWLAITPLLFLLLWSAGYVVAKVALVDAAPWLCWLCDLRPLLP